MKQNNYKKMFYVISEVDKAHTWTFFMQNDKPQEKQLLKTWS